MEPKDSNSKSGDLKIEVEVVDAPHRDVVSHHALIISSIRLEAKG